MEPWKIAFYKKYYLPEYTLKEEDEERILELIKGVKAYIWQSERAIYFKAGWEAFRDTLSSFIEKRSSSSEGSD